MQEAPAGDKAVSTLKEAPPTPRPRCGSHVGGTTVLTFTSHSKDRHAPPQCHLGGSEGKGASSGWEGPRAHLRGDRMGNRRGRPRSRKLTMVQWVKNNQNVPQDRN